MGVSGYRAQGCRVGAVLVFPEPMASRRFCRLCAMYLQYQLLGLRVAAWISLVYPLIHQDYMVAIGFGHGFEWRCPVGSEFVVKMWLSQARATNRTRIDAGPLFKLVLQTVSQV